jgi:hypothetical protein
MTSYMCSICMSTCRRVRGRRSSALDGDGDGDVVVSKGKGREEA